MPSRCRSRIRARSNSAKDPHDRQQQGRQRRVLAAEGQLFLDELDAHAVAGQLLHDAPQIVEVARQPVNAMHHHGVALARKGEGPVQFRTLQA